MISPVIKLENEKQNAHGRAVSSVHFSPNGALIVSGSWDRTIKVWGALQAQLPAPTSLSDYSFIDHYSR